MSVPHVAKKIVSYGLCKPSNRHQIAPPTLWMPFSTLVSCYLKLFRCCGMKKECWGMILAQNGANRTTNTELELRKCTRK